YFSIITLKFSTHLFFFYNITPLPHSPTLFPYTTLFRSLGLSFSNFSVRNITNLDAWKPLPSGDGQTLGLRAQTNGKYYQAYSINFVEPWLGGKKPNSLSVSLYYTLQTGISSRYGYYGYGYYDPYSYKGDDSRHIKVLGASLGLGRRLTWPDDWFTLYHELSYRQY